MRTRAVDPHSGDVRDRTRLLRRIAAIDAALKAEFQAHSAPIIELIEAQTLDPFCVLVGTILSARTKDACTAGAVKRLFAAGLARRPLGTDPTEETVPAVGTGPAVGTDPAVGTGPALGTGPAVGTDPALGTGPTLGTDPALGTGPIVGTDPATPFNADDLERLDVAEIERIIYPVGFFREKARHLKELPRVLKERFGGVLPHTVEELCELPGVGRKTANLTVAVGFGLPAICVDVHVHRISNRLGLVKTKTPLETEMALRHLLPVKYWKTWNSHLVSFGQTRCGPVRPKCEGCPIRRLCPA